MKTVKELYNRLNTVKTFNERYPDFDPGDGKVHILFLSPCLHESGYYRMILPALELNKTSTHHAIISHIQRWDFAKQFDDYDTPVDFRLVAWADYIVLPSMFSDLGYIVDSMRQINSDLEFVMDVDLNYHQLPAEHPDHSKLMAFEPMLLDNLKKIDIVTAPNPLILKQYDALAQQKEDEYLLYFESYGNLLSDHTFDELPNFPAGSKDRIRIGMVLESAQLEDIRTVVEPLTKLLTTYKDQVELVVFGWSPKIGEKHKLLPGLPVRYEKPVLFTHHHEKLAQLQIDIGLIPLASNEFNASGKALNRFLDFAALKIPVVISALTPFKNIIQDGENGLLALEATTWLEKIEQMIQDEALRKTISENAYQYAWKKFSYSEKALKRLASIFI